MTRVTHAFDVDLRRGNVACALSHLRVDRAIGDAFRQFSDFSCQGRIGKNSDA